MLGSMLHISPRTTYLPKREYHFHHPPHTESNKKESKLNRNFFLHVYEYAFNPTWNPIKRMRSNMLTIILYHREDSSEKHHNYFANNALLWDLKFCKDNPPKYIVFPRIAQRTKCAPLPFSTPQGKSLKSFSAIFYTPNTRLKEFK